MALRHGLPAACALLLFCSVPGTSRAQETEAAATVEPAPPPVDAQQACPWGSDRIINGHRFIFPAFIDSSFVLNYVDTRTGAYLRRVREVPTGRLGRVDLEQIEVAEAVSGGVRLFDGVGVFGTLSGGAVIGTNVSGLIFLPVEYNFAADGGAIVRVLRLKEAGTQVSLRARLGTASGRRLTIAPLLDAVANTPLRGAQAIAAGNLSELLVTPFSTFRWGGSVAAAQPLSEIFSLQASAGVEFEDSTFRPFDVLSNARRDRDLSVFSPSVGLAATGDARPLGVPLALMLEYELRSRRTEFEETDRHKTRQQNLLAAGLYYSGRSDLQAGLMGFAQLGLDPVEGTDASGNPAESERPQVFGGELVLRYVW